MTGESFGREVSQAAWNPLQRLPMVSSSEDSKIQDMPDVPGYSITQQLYAGSRTLVYRGVRQRDGLPVVMKLLRNPLPNFNEWVRFCNQYAIAKAIDLPTVVKMLEFETGPQSHVLVMEDCGGISLQDLLGRTGNLGGSPQTLTTFLRIAIQIATALEGLYNYRVIHKDLKPANILVDPETRQVKLIDFSIASQLPRETQEVKAVTALEGTLAYLSPEQTGRMNRGIDYRSDFYSLGITFYELLTGQLPCVSDDPMELIHWHLTKHPVPVHQVNSYVPLAVSAIVSKLLAKNAEDRYQSALGLKHDLETCLQQLIESNVVSDFAVGQRDISDRFLIPEMLYGRAEAVQSLLAAFERVAEGASELMLVAGFSGIGKTAVVNEVHKPIVRRRGYFIKGKYDQFQRNIPFSALVQALRDLMAQILGGSESELQRWQSRLLDALQENGQVLIAVIPELEQIIGPQPAVPELAGVAAQNRFNLLFQALIQALATAEHPLVMFLDDLQWADSASLALIQILLTEAPVTHLLLLGAYRDNEVFPGHPLMLMLEKRHAEIVQTLTLGPLLPQDVNYLVADTLSCSDAIAQPLARLVYQKTSGDPFFAIQFLKALHSDGWISFNRRLGSWECDLAQVQRLSVREDIAVFMAQRLQKLPAATQVVLKLAACLGNLFDLATLAMVADQTQSEVAAALWPALKEELVLPRSEIYKFYQGRDSRYGVEVPQHGLNNDDSCSDYQFLHDRVQQAAYSLIPEQAKQSTHLHIGRRLLECIPPAEQDGHLFEIVNQLNLGTALIAEPAEQEKLALLNLAASRKAKQCTAYHAAMDYANMGIRLLSAQSWQTHYDVAIALHGLAAEVAYLCGDFQRMETCAQAVLQHARSLFDKIDVYNVQILAYTAANQPLEAVELALQILPQLGITLPVSPTDTDIQQALEAVADLHPPEGIASLVNRPRMTDRATLAALQILNAIFTPCYAVAPRLIPLISATGAKLSMTHGSAPLSAIAYAGYGMLLCGVADDLAAGYEFGQLALNLLPQFSQSAIQTRVMCMVASFVLHWRSPLRDTTATLQAAFQSGLETGDLQYTAWSYYHDCQGSYLSGQDLSSLERKLTHYEQALTQIKQDFQRDRSEMLHQVVLNLLGQSPSPCELVGQIYDERVAQQQYQASNNTEALYFLHFHHLLLGYWFGRIELAWDAAAAAARCLTSVPAQAVVPVFYVYDSLVCLAHYPTLAPAAQQSAMARVQANQARLAHWKTFAPMNYQHKFDLVEAECARVLGQTALAIDAYDRAIAGAKTNGYLQEQALANELAAKFYQDWGKERVAASYMQDAYYGYAHWGAKAKVYDLECRYAKLLAPILHPQRAVLSTAETLFVPDARTTLQIAASQPASVDGVGFSATLDLAAILKVSQALSQEIEFAPLLTILLQTILQNAGADKGVLLMPREQTWFVEAVAIADQPVRVQPTALSDSLEIPYVLINTVRRQRRSVVVMDAAVHPMLDSDAYILQHQPKSLLCTPIFQQEQLVAILYLENHALAGVFTGDHLEILSVFCAQAAISLENARLYQQSQMALQELQQSRQFLKKVIDNIPQLIFWKNRDSTFLGCNASAAEVLNLETPEQIIGKTDYEFSFTPEEIEGYLQCDRRVMDSGQAELNIVETQQRADGSQVWLETSKIPLRDANNDVMGILLILSDITDRRNSEITTKAFQERLTFLVQETPIGIIEWNPEFQVVHWNPAAEKIFGYPAAEMLGHHAIQIVPESLRPYVAEVMTSLMDQRGGFYSLNQNIRKDGTLITCEWTNTPLRNAEGNAIGIFSMVQDISDRKAAEVALQNSEQRFRDVTEAAGEYIWELDAAGRYTYVTARVKQVKGYEPAELLGRSPLEFMPPEDSDAVQEILSTASIGKDSFTLQHRDTLPNGDVVWEEVSGLPMLNDRGEIIGFRGTGLSITERKQAEQRIQQKSQELEQALQELQNTQLQMIQAEKMASLGNLMAGIAHEINNPLGFLNGSISNAQEYVHDLLGHLSLYQQHHSSTATSIQDHATAIDLEFLTEDLPKLLDSMREATDRIKSISISLRAFSRSDKEYKVSANLHEGIDGALMILKYRLKASPSRPEIVVIKDYGELPDIHCFPGQLNQVFMNILANAIDMFDEVAQQSSFVDLQTNPQKITIQTTLTAGNTVEIRMSDNGGGISEDVKAKIFVHLFTTKCVGKGTGLGLAIARQIVVEKHGGTIAVESELGQGTTLTISLPG